MKLAGSFVLLFVLTSIAVLHAAPPITPVGPEPNLPQIQGTAPAPVTPTSTSLLCVSSKSVVFFGRHGLGCRETRPSIWRAQGCTSTMGCCAAESGCLVSSATNAISGDGIY